MSKAGVALDLMVRMKKAVSRERFESKLSEIKEQEKKNGLTDKERARKAAYENRLSLLI